MKEGPISKSWNQEPQCIKRHRRARRKVERDVPPRNVRAARKERPTPLPPKPTRKDQTIRTTLVTRIHDIPLCPTYIISWVQRATAVTVQCPERINGYVVGCAREKPDVRPEIHRISNRRCGPGPAARARRLELLIR